MHSHVEEATSARSEYWIRRTSNVVDGAWHSPVGLYL